MTVANWISFVVGAAGIIFGLVTLFRNKRQDDAAEGQSAGTILSDIGYIKAGVDEIKAEQKEQRKTNIDLLTRLTSVEESVKQAHKRIDEIKKD